MVKDYTLHEPLSLTEQIETQGCDQSYYGHSVSYLCTVLPNFYQCITQDLLGYSFDYVTFLNLFVQSRLTV